MLVTYLGFGIGAVNVLFLYTNFMSDTYYGLIQVMLSAALILMPLMAFGVPNTLVKFYSSFQDQNQKEGFLTLMLLFPLLLIIPIGLLSYFANEAIGTFLARENPEVKGYVWYIFWIGFAMAYFEVFYAWTRVHLKSVFGNFMKEVFCRVGQTVLLVLLYFDSIDVSFFLKALVVLYLARTLIMKGYAYHLHRPRLKVVRTLPNWKIFSYSLIIILGGSTAIILLEIDKVMLNHYVQIENVAYYSVAGFMASAVGVPGRAMHQITYPLTAKLLNEKDFFALKRLYQKSALTLFVISGLLFVLLLSNLNDLYLLLPDTYGGAWFIVFWIGMAKVSDAVLGNNNAILYNSDYYRAVLFMGMGLALLTIVFNLWLIPEYGIKGAAIASFMAFLLYNTIKLLFVWRTYGMLPFTVNMGKVLAVLFFLLLLFQYVRPNLPPLVNIAIKTVLMGGFYFGVVYRLNVSEDISAVIGSIFRRIKKE